MRAARRRVTARWVLVLAVACLLADVALAAARHHVTALTVSAAASAVVSIAGCAFYLAATRPRARRGGKDGAR
jgi:hypothetical protein